MSKREDRFVRDAEIAAYLRVSCSWVRKQRMYRMRGIPHFFSVDPVYIGSMPRYRADAFRAWADSLKPSAPNAGHITPKKAGKNG